MAEAMREETLAFAAALRTLEYPARVMLVEAVRCAVGTALWALTTIVGDFGEDLIEDGATLYVEGLDDLCEAR